jgi:hypothetical protein
MSAPRGGGRKAAKPGETTNAATLAVAAFCFSERRFPLPRLTFGRAASRSRENLL